MSKKHMLLKKITTITKDEIRPGKHPKYPFFAQIWLALSDENYRDIQNAKQIGVKTIDVTFLAEPKATCQINIGPIMIQVPSSKIQIEFPVISFTILIEMITIKSSNLSFYLDSLTDGTVEIHQQSCEKRMKYILYYQI